MDENKLEQKFLFRLIKVTYYVALIIGIFFIGIFGWETKPTKYQDISKSYIVCPNGNKYLINDFKIYSSYISPENDLSIKTVCHGNIAKIRNTKTGEEKEVTLSELSQYGVSIESKVKDTKYEIVYVNSTRGSWRSVILWWIVGSYILYIVLNIIKETLLYMFFGKKFSWDFLQQN